MGVMKRMLEKGSNSKVKYKHADDGSAFLYIKGDKAIDTTVKAYNRKTKKGVSMVKTHQRKKPPSGATILKNYQIATKKRTLDFVKQYKKTDLSEDILKNQLRKEKVEAIKATTKAFAKKKDIKFIKKSAEKLYERNADRYNNLIKVLKIKIISPKVGDEVKTKKIKGTITAVGKKKVAIKTDVGVGKAEKKRLQLIKKTMKRAKVKEKTNKVFGYWGSGNPVPATRTMNDVGRGDMYYNKLIPEGESWKKSAERIGLKFIQVQDTDNVIKFKLFKFNKGKLVDKIYRMNRKDFWDFINTGKKIKRKKK